MQSNILLELQKLGNLNVIKVSEEPREYSSKTVRQGRGLKYEREGKDSSLVVEKRLSEFSATLKQQTKDTVHQETVSIKQELQTYMSEVLRHVKELKNNQDSNLKNLATGLMKELQSTNQRVSSIAHNVRIFGLTCRVIRFLVKLIGLSRRCSSRGMILVDLVREVSVD